MLAAGWNRQPEGTETCLERGFCTEPGHTCLTQSCQSRAIHAEVCALGTASQFGLSCVGASLYVTHTPCFGCLRVAVAHGVTDIYYYGEQFTPWSPVLEWCQGQIGLHFQGREIDLEHLAIGATSDFTYPILAHDKAYRSADRAAHYGF